MQIFIDSSFGKIASKAIIGAARIMVKELEIENDLHAVIFIPGTVDLPEDASGLAECYSGYGIIQLCTKVEIPLMIETVFHEMVHIKQYVKEELVCIEKGFLWKGKLHKFKNTADVLNREYSQYMALPWEAEAYTIQDMMLERLDLL